MSYILHCGDCLEYMRGMETGSVDCVVTDPPYGIASVVNTGKGAGWDKWKATTDKRREWDKKPNQHVFDNILRIGKSSIIWGGNYFQLPVSRGWLVWVKPERGFSMSESELAWTSFDMPMRVWEGRRSDPGREHPTQKPIGLMRWCIENYTAPGDTIFDPFMGSGTTGVAAIQTGRNFIGCELDPDYFAIAERRIRNAQPPLFVDQPAPVSPPPEQARLME